MQYIWMIMLGILYILFWIAVICDIRDTHIYNKKVMKKGGAFPHFKELESLTVGFIFLHFLALFCYSLMCWLCR